MSIIAGTLITDGTAVFIIDDVRDGSRVGDIILRPTLRDGFVKANGATVTASEYPRLLHFAQDNNLIVTAEVYATDCSKYVYDSVNDELTLPNVVGRVLQGGNTVASVEAGLPNITGSLGQSGGRPFVGSTGALRAGGGSGDNRTVIGTGDTGDISFSFNASISNSIYGASTTVQPPAITLIPQIKY